MPSWAWALAVIGVLAAAAVLLGACKRGFDNPIVLGTLAAAQVVTGDGMDSAEEERLNGEHQEKVARLRALCAAIETEYRDSALLRSRAEEAEYLGLAVGHDIMEPRHRACVAFHAEAAGHFETAYRLYFSAAIDSLFEREWIAEHGGGPPIHLSDTMHYAVLDAILRLRTSGHAIEIYHVGASKVTSYTCARLRREAPGIATCR